MENTEGSVRRRLWFSVVHGSFYSKVAAVPHTIDDRNFKVKHYWAKMTLPTILFFCVLFSTAFAQTFTTGIGQQKIGKNQYLEVSYEVQDGSSVDNFQAPRFKDWEVVSGPNGSSAVTSINGKVSRSQSYSFYLQPLKTGMLTVPGARITVDGRLMTSNNTTVEVMNKNVAGSQPQANANDPFASIFDDPFANQRQAEAERRQQAENEFNNAQILRPGEDIDKKVADNVILKAITSKSTCYEGEPIIATYKIYTRLDLINADFSKRPSFSGFSAYDLEVPDRNYTVENLNGKAYRVYTYRKVQLYPLQNGTLTLDPVELDFGVKLAKYEAVATGFADPYNDGNFVQKNYALKSQPSNIQVLPLPVAGKPAGFKGAVGNFSITAEMDEHDPGKDDAVDLHISIKGNGNFSMVHAPAIAWPQSVEAYDPQEKENLVKSQVPITGEKSFDYVFLCHQPGRVTIPPITFSYFDAASKTYKTVATQAMQLDVSPESKRPKLEASNSDTNWPQMFIDIAQYVLPVLAIGLVVYLAFMFLMRRKKKQRQNESDAMDEAWERLVNKSGTTAIPAKLAPVAEAVHVEQTIDFGDDNHRYMPIGTAAAPIAVIETLAEEELPLRVKSSHSHYFPKAEDALWEQDHQTFYKALKSELLHAMAMVAGLSALDRNILISALQQKGADNNILQQLNLILDECDAAIYSPVDMGTNRQQTLEEAGFLIHTLGKMVS